jgi:hypothetical protein
MSFLNSAGARALAKFRKAMLVSIIEPFKAFQSASLNSLFSGFNAPSSAFAALI